MKKYHVVEPEVMVGLGGQTTFKDENRTEVLELHIDLEDWLGDDLMENSSCYIVTENLKNGLENKNYTGFIFDEITLTKAEYFRENYNLDKPFPEFFWMKIVGQNGDDFYIFDENLQISERALNFIKEEFQTNFLDIDKEEDKEIDAFINELIKKDSKQK